MELCRYGVGFGLSYGAKFEYSALSVAKGANGSISVSVTVANTGTREARTVVQVRALTCQSVNRVQPCFCVCKFHHANRRTSLQVYLSGAKVPGLVTPQINLVAFDKVPSVASGAHQTVRDSLGSSVMVLVGFPWLDFQPWLCCRPSTNSTLCSQRKRECSSDTPSENLMCEGCRTTMPV